MKNILHWVCRPPRLHQVRRRLACIRYAGLPACIRCAGVSPASGTQASRLPYFFLVLALLFSSCEKDKDTLPKDRILLTTEKHLSPEKTSVSGTTVQWVSGDMVRLYIGGFEENLPVAISGTNAYVDGWKVKSGVIRAYYPNTIICQEEGATDVPTVTIPSRYDSYYSGGRQVLALPMVAKAPNGATTVEFKHLTAALMVNLKNETTYELTLDSVVVSSSEYMLCGVMSLDLTADGLGVFALEGSGSVTVRFSGITLGTSGFSSVQIPIRPIGESDLQIQIYAHRQGAAISIEGVPAVNKTVVYHYNDHKQVSALGRNVMMSAGIVLSSSGHTTPEEIDNSIFSVSSNKRVRFSKGNLWYHNSSYAFHTNQYDTDATPSNSNKDLFPWNATYISGWDVLSAEEWNYIVNNTSRTAIRFVKACVNSVNGLIIFSDTYHHPIAQALVKVNVDGSMNFSDNTFTTDQWNSMQAAGAIFLPAAGYLNGSTVESYGGEGDYWSSTTDGDGKAKRLEFTSSELTTDNGIIGSYGCSVRLVKEATR